MRQIQPQGRPRKGRPTTPQMERKTRGIESAPDRQRQTGWAALLKAHWDVLAAIDFTMIEVWTKGDLVA